MLSKVTDPGLPYILSERRILNCFWTDFTIDDEPEKRKPRDRVACRLYTKVFALKDMLARVGIHILYHARDYRDEI